MISPFGEVIFFVYMVWESKFIPGGEIPPAAPEEKNRPLGRFFSYQSMWWVQYDLL
jgi:hypothetical protein